MTEDKRQEFLDKLGEGLSKDTGELGMASVAVGPSVEQLASDTAIAMDLWSRRRGRELYESSGGIQKVLPDETKGEAQETIRRENELAVSDFLTAAFEFDPQPVEVCEDERRHRFCSQLLQTPEYHALHSKTKMNEVASQLAAMSFCEQWAKLQEEEEPEKEIDKDVQALNAAHQAVKAAGEDVGQLSDMMGAMGLGGNGAEPSASMDREKLLGMFERVRGSDVQAIIDLAGRYRRFAQQMQRKKTIHGQDDMVGVRLGNELDSILPHELALLDDEDLQWDTLRRYTERSLMCRDYHGSESEARGPIVVVVDESGSMSGERIHQAKAMALAMAWIARHQQRWCCLGGFAGGTEGNWLPLPVGKWDMDKLFDWLDHFYGGGTSLDVPLVELPKKWDSFGCPKGRTDIIIVTDGIVRAPDEMVRSFNRFKAIEQAKLFTFVIGGKPGDLEKVSNSCHEVDDLSLENDGVKEVLSI